MEIIITGVPKKISSGIRTHTESLRAGLLEHQIPTSNIDSYPKGIYKLISSLPIRVLKIFNKDLAEKWKYQTRKYYTKRDIKKIIKHCNNETVFNIQSVAWYHLLKPLIKDSSIPIVLTVHGHYSDELRTKGYGDDIVARAISLEKDAYKSVSGIIAVGSRVKDYVKDISGREDIEVISNGITPLSYNHKRTITNTKEIRCIFVGSLHSHKGVDIAIKAIAKAASHGIDVSLDIIGDGEEKRKLIVLTDELGLTNKVNFLGAIPNNKVRVMMQNYDFSLIPSKPFGETGEEAFNCVCIESMDAGLITIASKIGGLGKIITDGFDGFLVPHSNVDKISDIFLRYNESIDGFSEIRSNATETVREKYSSKAMAEKYIGIYKKVLDRTEKK